MAEVINDEFSFDCDKRNYILIHKAPRKREERHFFSNPTSMFRFIVELKLKGFVLKGKVSFPDTKKVPSIESVLDSAGEELMDWVFSLKDSEKKVA
jgi:hypothetical protein